MTGLTITAILLGTALSITFILFLVAPYLKSKQNQQRLSETQMSLPRKAAGSFSFILGLLLFFGWFYFLAQREAPYSSPLGPVLAHMLLMLVSSIALVIAGVSMLKNWKRSALLFWSALGLLHFSLIISLLQYGNMGHPVLMNGIAIAIVVVLIYFVALIYAFEHYVFHFDEEDKKERGK